MLMMPTWMRNGARRTSSTTKMRRTFLLVLLLSTVKTHVYLVLVSAASSSATQAVVSVECEVDGTCSSTSSTSTTSRVMECGLYLAESTIPHAGYGVYTGQAISKNLPLTTYHDVVIQYADVAIQRKLQKEIYHRDIPKLLLREYFWKSSETYSTFDAQEIDSIVPGFGMLANCALGLVNHEQATCQLRGVMNVVETNTTLPSSSSPLHSSSSSGSSRSGPSTGASSEYQDCYFITRKDIPIGHEMFDNYGDDWFISRKSSFGTNIPLTDDFTKANRIVRLWQQLQHVQQSQTSLSNHPNFTADFYDMIILKGIKQHLPTRTQHALPLTSEQAQHIDYTARHTNNSVAYYGLTNNTAIRSIEWLNQNGMCLDHIMAQPVANRPAERGAFARRFIPQGQRVAPAPLIHLSRRHTDMIYADMVGGVPKTVLWQGHQLLLNYCYGHPKSSMLLFPYSHGVNLINHPTNAQQANVGLRWSTRMKHPEWLQYNVSQLLEEHNDRSGLMMEFYALSDIPEGHEILYDYGTAWQQAWEKHVELWNRTINDAEAAVVHSENYISAYDYEQQCNYNMSQLKQQDENSYYDHVPDCFTAAPSWIATRCWIADSDTVTTASTNSDNDNDNWLNWMAPDDAEYNKTTREIYYYGVIDDTFPCEVLNYSNSSTATMDHFRVRLQYEEGASLEDGWNITNVPRSAIIMVDRPYTGNQFLRQAFRHEIQLPDEMVPELWKDLQPNQDGRCGLYMAESAIPFSGLGMYTGIDISKEQKLFSGDVVVQVEDIDLNTKLRHWAAKDYDYTEKDWLLGNYYWSPETSLGIYEAQNVQSIIPGFGMLANSHTGLVNANIRAPTRYFDLSRGHDPGTGASTTFHNVYFDAKIDIEAGAELFVQYGDAWFEDREDLGFIPLSTDFKEADRTVRFLQQATKNLTNTLKNDPQDFVADFLGLVRSMVASKPRLANAYPKDFNSFKVATEAGTATLTVPNRVRTLEWLEANGRCLDNIRPELSTIRQAGRGAFATRNMKKGDIITPMPLVHILRRHMEIYHGDDYENKDGSFWIDGKQLLLNYCYGHPESSILLFPYAPVSNYINHNVSYSNAELRWSTLPNHHADWLERSPDSLDTENHSGLIMELVATRDIGPDEEIFLNYGSHWENAWNQFTKKQQLHDFDRHFTSSEALNNRLEWIKTIEEQEDEPYKFSNNEDIRTVCFTYKSEKNLLLNATEKSMKTYRWSGTDRLIHADYSYPCYVVARHLKDYDIDEAYDRQDSVFPAPITYTVILIDEDMKIVDVPRKAIQFFDDEYISDNTWRKAFRHEIHLPDHMVPPIWRDLRPSDGSR